MCLYQALKYHESAIPDYSALHGVDPGDLLAEEFMSDYLSGPEDEDIESVAAWKLRMVRVNGIDRDKMDPSTFSKLIFWEKVHPKWQSNKVSATDSELENQTKYQLFSHSFHQSF